MRKIIYYCLPPFIYKSFKFIYQSIFETRENISESVFDGENLLFKDTLKNTNFYGEYGVGKSTVYVSQNSNNRIISVDSSEKWIESTLSEIKNENSEVELKFVNIGKIAEWGYPFSYEKKENFKLYREYIWTKKEKPDFVLIDGRFRVACFLTCLKFSDKGTKIIFDDYTNRGIYHMVEIFEKPIKTYNRQALFVSSGNYDNQKLDEYISKFEYVFQ